MKASRLLVPLLVLAACAAFTVGVVALARELQDLASHAQPAWTDYAVGSELRRVLG